MCDPITIAVVTTAAAGGLSAFSQYKEGVAQSKYYNYQADQARQEAVLAQKQGDAQSKLVQDSAKSQGKQLAEDQATFNASQRAQMAAMGLTGVTGEDITNDAFSKQKMDELVLRNNADVKSWEINEQAKNKAWASNIEADQLGYASKNARRAGKRQAFGTLLSTASKVATLGMK